MCCICCSTLTWEIWSCSGKRGLITKPSLTCLSDSRPYWSHDSRWGQLGVFNPCANAFIAPHSEWPQTIMSETLREERENSMAAVALLSWEHREAGGIKFPIFRRTNKSPGFVEAKRLGTTRLSEQAIKRASGFARWQAFQRELDFLCQFFSEINNSLN